MEKYKVVIEPEAQKDLTDIYNFIAEHDTDVKAKHFLQKLQKAIDSLAFMPQRCRKSIYVTDDRTRDMIISGYTICYHIDEKIVHIVAVFRQRAI